MNLSSVLAHWRSDRQISTNIVDWETLPGRQANFVPFPSGIQPSLQAALEQRGITQLYTHQASTWQLLRDGKNVVIVTGTASGKTLCYNLPVLSTILSDPSSTALYIFPTKALSQDQHSVLQSLLSQIERLEPVGSIETAIRRTISTGIYDGDTPGHVRSPLRQSHIIITNPDMLHTGILPHHTAWAGFFRSLRFVVIDEIHYYRGVFGSHIANVMRRLGRIANFYGAHPQFILTSATIGNPGELGAGMVNQLVEVVSNDGAEKGEKHFLIYNPPIIDKSLGLRKSAIQESVNLANELLENNIQTIIFSRARRTVEIILTYLREQRKYTSLFRSSENAGPDKLIRGYRSGYLPAQRREIEAGLRKGAVKIVVATNALELGIDIGSMEAALMVGYPGTIASAWQEAGRAGRGDKPSLALLVASPSPIDQYLAHHPEYFFSQTPEHGMINPDNLPILLGHLRCAAFELPFRDGEVFGKIDPGLMQELMDLLVAEGILHHSGDKYFWTADTYPAQAISLRSASSERVLLQTEGNPPGEGRRTIGEVDISSAHWLTHPGAIYMHEGVNYLVEELDLENHFATLLPTSVDYYTEPRREVEVQLVEKQASETVPGGEKSFGEIQVQSQVIGYRRVRWHTNETLGIENIDMPMTELLTDGYWLSLNDATVGKLRDEGMWTNAANDYGPTWPRQRDLARARDGFRCQVCGQLEGANAHPVHHKIPFRMFETAVQANQLANLVTLCNACHKKVETAVRIRSGLAGLAFTLGNLAPLFLMCDSGDIGIHSDPQSTLADGQPSVVLYDMVPGGIGLSQRLYEIHGELIQRGLDLVSSCECEDGCPSCVGPGGEGGSGGKKETLALLRALV